MLKCIAAFTDLPPERVLQIVALPIEAPELVRRAAGAALGAGGAQDGVPGREGGQTEPGLIWRQGEPLREVLGKRKMKIDFLGLTH